MTTAIRSGDAETVLNAAQHDPSLLQEVTPFGTWLHFAAHHGQLEIVKGLVEMGADLNERAGTFDGTPVNLAAGYGHEKVVRYLLEAGATLDVSEPERNPLFSAVQGGHIEIVRLLIEAGIDSSIRYSGRSMKNMDARAFALEQGQIDIAAYLADV